MVLGAIGTVALASPASATNTKISYEVKCGPEANTAVLSWSVENELRQDAVVSDLSRKLDGIADGDTIKGKTTATGTEVVDLSDRKKWVKLELRLKWGQVAWPFEKVADVSKLDCTPQPTAEFTDKCDGTTVVKVTNPKGGKPAKIAVTGYGEWVERKDLEPGDVWEVTVPAKHAQHVRVKFPGGDHIVDHNWKSPEECYSVTHKSTCDKLTITVVNEGVETLKASVKFGDKEETTEIPAGKSDTATFEGAEGLVVTLTVGKKSKEINYTKPADCTPLLPVTGVNAGLLAGAAFVLVSGGAGLFFVARRRRIRFAA
jgi:hypothetical protein